MTTRPQEPKKDLRQAASAGVIGPEGEVPFWRTEIGDEELSAVAATFDKKTFEDILRRTN